MAQGLTGTAIGSILCISHMHSTRGKGTERPANASRVDTSRPMALEAEKAGLIRIGYKPATGIHRRLTVIGRDVTNRAGSLTGV